MSQRVVTQVQVKYQILSIKKVITTDNNYINDNIEKKGLISEK